MEGGTEEVRLRRRLAVLWATAIMLLTVLVCSGIALAITYGTQDNGRHPNVGALVDGGGAYCSGTLVGPAINKPVFLTAAHCGTDGQSVDVTFDETYDPSNPSASTQYSGTFYADPQYSGRGNTAGHDIAVVVLDTDPGLSPASLPKLNSLSKLPKGQKFTAVGYGAETGKDPSTNTRRWAVSSLTSTQPYYLSLSQNAKKGYGGTCYGDSGGPNFVWNKSNTSETTVNAALTNTGDALCKAKNTVLRLDTQAAQGFLDDYVMPGAFVAQP
jgi:secreted trypsin-like serine protease